MKKKNFDIIVWGSTGFTGKLVTEYLIKKYGVGHNLQWAIAGRNKEKLEQIKNEFSKPNLPFLVANANDLKSLEKMASQTKVLCTTVGPYAKYGTDLVEICIKNGTHYCDLAGEVQWIRKIIDRFHQKAQTKKIKIVNSCGFDSIPSDLGVYYIQKELSESNLTRAKRIEMRVAGIKGGISGGTYASLSNVRKEASKNKSIYKTLMNPYGLNPVGKMDGPDKPDLKTILYDKCSDNWIAPFVMASINTKIVRRSNALTNFEYGKNFFYSEATLCGKGVFGKIKAYLISFPLLILAMAKPGGFLKKIIDLILPSPGEGPSKKSRESGFFNFRFYIDAENGKKRVAKVTGDMDPGYGSTSKMIAESAVCLAKDSLPDFGGVLTPSVAMGNHLLNRLRKNAGLTFNLKKT